MFLLLLGVVFIVVYLYLHNRFQYWAKQDVPNPPVNFLLGNMLDAAFFRKSLGQVYSDVYTKFPGYSYVGFFKNRQPAIVVRDPALIEDVLVKQFSSFHDNDMQVDPANDPLFAKSVFVLNGNQWKTTRNQVMACFTPAKMKLVYPIIEVNCNKFVNYVENLIKETGDNGIDAKLMCGRFAAENVATCAFGLDGQSFEKENSEFIQLGMKVFNPGVVMAIKHLILFIEPSLAPFISVKFFPDDVTQRLTEYVHKVLQHRGENNIKRNDFLDVLNDIKNKQANGEFTLDDITAHAAAFFVDGFETSSIIMSYTLFAIANNPDIQSRLRDEIDHLLAENNGKLTYDNIWDFEYLDCIINETFRLYPTVLFMNRLASTDITLPHPKDVNKKPVQIPKGTPIIIPIYGLHSDEKYFPDPEKFDPDRFSKENSGMITKYTFMPFGEGPRICLGQRFGLFQVKAGLISIVRNFDLRVNSKTITPLKVNPQYFMMSPIGGIWLDISKRN